MIARALLCGFGLLCLQAGSALAQTVADTPVRDQPTLVDATSKNPTSIPEIIRDRAGHDNVGPSQAVIDPEAAARPPTMNLGFLRAIRLDWDQLGDQSLAAK